MNVFVTGASGYIGFNVAKAFRRAGHQVAGLARSVEKAARLEQAEIVPVIGTLQKPDGFAGAIRACSVVVHTAADMKADFPALDRATVEAILKVAADGPRPKTFIYTSGVWVLGNTGFEPFDETVPPAPAKMVAWRPAVEQMVVHSKEVRGLVIRPGCVYGKQGGLTGMWFGGAFKEKAVTVIGDGKNRWAVVHVDDLADVYVRAAESGLSGEIFNVADRSRNTVAEMAEAAARAAGCPGAVKFLPLAEAVKQMGDFAGCLALDQHADARKAVRLLGWQPKHGGFVDDASVFARAWKAWSEKQS